MLVGRTAADSADGNSFVKRTKIVVPLNYLSNFWRSLEMPSTHFYQCSTYVDSRKLVFTSKMIDKHQWKSDILSKDEGQ